MSFKKKPVHRTALTTALAAVQVEALKQSDGQYGFAWYMEMGLGKTLTALTEFDRLASVRTVTRLLVICPNSFKAGWLAEAIKHHFNFDVMIYEAPRKKQAQAWVARGFSKAAHPFDRPPVMIINYESVRANKETHTSAGLETVKSFVAPANTMLVVDESIAMKNNQAAQTKSIKRLVLMPTIKIIRMLSGKPTTQGPHDYWGQLHTILCVKESYYSFRNRYCRMGGWQGKQVLGAQNEQELADRMQGFVFKALKMDPRWGLGLPPKSYTTRSYADEFRKSPLWQHYQEMEITFMTALRDAKRQPTGGMIQAKIILDQMQKLSQIMCGFSYKENQEGVKLVPDEQNPRLKLLLETLETEVQHKVAICYFNKYVGAQLRETLAARGYGVAQLMGGMHREDIEEEKRRFNEDDDCDVILLQIRTAKFGHTILGQQDKVHVGKHCATMIFYQNNYSLDDRSQVEDRIHRIGQTQPCTYVDFAGASMDAHITQALQHKQRVYAAVMDLVA